MGYAKLWGDIVTSSIWEAPDKARIMWITFLASADATGFVAGSIPGMARMARMTVEEGEAAIKILEGPDNYSRSTEFDGRRIEWVKDLGGWVILNYDRFRTRRDPEKRREYMREYMRKKRAEEKSK